MITLTYEPPSLSPDAPDTAYTGRLMIEYDAPWNSASVQAVAAAALLIIGDQS